MVEGRNFFVEADSVSSYGVDLFAVYMFDVQPYDFCYC